MAACEAIAQRADRPKKLELVAYEIDPDLAKQLRAVLRNARTALSSRLDIEFRVIVDDFILSNAEALSQTLFRGGSSRFDLIIANPPYFKLNKADARARACPTLVHGQPNIYGLFMGIAAYLLRPGGRFCFITPRSWASGPYFECFRRRFFEIVRPDEIHLFDSRKASFRRDEVLQEVMVTWGTREDGWLDDAGAARIQVGVSEGIHDLSTAKQRLLDMDDLLDPRDRHLILKLPASEAEDEIVDLVHSWSGSLAKHGLKISTGPVVHFRALEHLLSERNGDAVPLLWLSNVRPMHIRWPIGLSKKPEYIRESSQSAYILVPNRNYVLLRRFSAKEEARRLVAAPYFSSVEFETVGFENHLNYIYRPGGTVSAEEAWGLAALLNSSILDQYFRCVNGNTQVSATELRAMPLPALDVITQIGDGVRGQTDLARIDAVVSTLVSPRRHRERSVA